jgi:hypothetical protein
MFEPSWKSAIHSALADETNMVPPYGISSEALLATDFDLEIILAVENLIRFSAHCFRNTKDLRPANALLGWISALPPWKFTRSENEKLPIDLRAKLSWKIEKRKDIAFTATVQLMQTVKVGLSW